MLRMKSQKNANRSGRLKNLAILSLLTGIVINSPLAQANEFSLSGYYKAFFVVFDPPRYEPANLVAFPDQMMGLVNQRLRLNAQATLSPHLSINLAYSLSPRIQDPLLFNEDPFLSGIELFRYRAKDLKRQLYPGENSRGQSVGLFQNLDRAYLNLRLGKADIYLGRQAIAWGSARVLNPTDLIAPFTFEELDTEDRVGVDALRVRMPAGLMGEIDGGWVFGPNFNINRSAVYLRGKFYWAKTDISLIMLDFHNNLLLGFDLARAVGGAGAWLEGAYVLVKAFSPDYPGEKKNYLRLTTGADYSFRNGTYAFIEYHFSGAGENNPRDYLRGISRPGVAEGAVYLLGKHYLASGVTHPLTPLISLTGQALINLGDPSCFIAPHIEYNLAENVYLSAGAFVGLGSRPRVTVDPFLPPQPLLRSEFGSYPHIFFSSFRLYF